MEVCQGSSLGGGGGIGNAALVLDACDIDGIVLVTCDIGGGGIGNAALELDTCDIGVGVLVTCDIGGDTTATYGSCMATSVGAPDGDPGGNLTNGGLVAGSQGMRTFDGCPGGGDMAGGYADLGLISG